MLTLADMCAISRARLAEAVALVRAGHHDTAVYLCGYAVELSLKARICRTLGWTEFPGEPKEWEKHHAFLKVHDLRLLAKWTGFEATLNDAAYDRQWRKVCEWNPESRYRKPGSQTRATAISTLRSTRALTDLLNPR